MYILRILLVLFIIYVFLYIFILLFLPATTESASGSSLRMQSNKNSPVSGMMRFTGESCFLFLSFFPCRAFLLFHDSLECGSQTCQSLQIGRNNNLRCFSIRQNTKCLETL